MKKILSSIASLSLSIFVVLFLTANQALAAVCDGKGIEVCMVSFIKPANFTELLTAILGVFVVIATPIVVLFIIYSGFLYVTAKGNSEQTQKATRSLTYSIIGGVLIIGAVAISKVIENVVNAFTAP